MFFDAANDNWVLITPCPCPVLSLWPIPVQAIKTLVFGPGVKESVFQRWLQPITFSEQVGLNKGSWLVNFTFHQCYNCLVHQRYRSPVLWYRQLEDLVLSWLLYRYKHFFISYSSSCFSSCCCSTSVTPPPGSIPAPPAPCQAFLVKQCLQHKITSLSSLAWDTVRRNTFYLLYLSSYLGQCCILVTRFEVSWSRPW